MRHLIVVSFINLTLLPRKLKLDHYQDGVCYLTSHRIIYVDNSNPLEYSIELGLYLVKDIESYVSFPYANNASLY